jgi:hypothetical protein
MLELLIQLGIILIPRLIEAGLVKSDETLAQALGRLAAARQGNAEGEAEWQERLRRILAGEPQQDITGGGGSGHIPQL